MTQLLVFWLVAAAFTTIYITQPVLPVLRVEFGVSATEASLTVSSVVLGIALSNLPFGAAADRHPIRPIILLGGGVVSACSFACAITHHFGALVAIRFVQGLFIPSMTTCLAAYLARSLEPERLNVVMGSYVAATVAGGLGGRLLGGWIHPPLHWRYAFVTAGTLLLCAVAVAARVLPREAAVREDHARKASFLELVSRPDLLRIFAVGFSAFFVFSAVFNYLPFYLSQPPISAPVRVITMAYLAYLVGMLTAPIAGRISNRLGSGRTLVLGAVVFAVAVAITLVRSLPAIVVGLAAICAGFFTVHSAAVGALNRRLQANRGRANSLYVLFYYAGGAAGISATGYAWTHDGWPGCVALGLAVLTIPLFIGLYESRQTPARW